MPQQAAPHWRPAWFAGRASVGAAPMWDDAARRVLAHDTGALRVLGGPGTGKTTLLLAAVAARVAAGVSPERTLLLVGSRRAAG